MKSIKLSTQLLNFLSTINFIKENINPYSILTIFNSSVVIIEITTINSWYDTMQKLGQLAATCSFEFHDSEQYSTYENVMFNYHKCPYCGDIPCNEQCVDIQREIYESDAYKDTDEPDAYLNHDGGWTVC